MSADDIGAILRKLDDLDRRLDSIDREHAEDMESLRANLRVISESHQRCTFRCEVANQELILAALKSSSTNLTAVKDKG
jgi:hypothetical protein